MSILQGYDIEIRHIPGKVNPADAITRQVKGDDLEYAGKVKQMDEDWVSHIRVPMEANDEDIQKRLNQLYSTKELQEKKVSVQNQLMAINANEMSAVLSVAESSIQIEESMKQRMMQVLATEEQYSHILEQLHHSLFH